MSSSQLIDFQSFFTLGDPLAKRPLRLTTQRDSDWITTRQVSALFRGQLSKTEQPLRLAGYMGSQVTDFLWTGLPPLVCISHRTVQLLRDQGFSGWSTYPVEIYDRKSMRLPEYFGFAVTGRGGESKRDRSEVVTKPPPVPGGKPYQVYKGLYFDESQWDGSDIFLVDAKIVVTKAVRDAFKQSKISNVLFTCLIDVETDVLLDKYGK